MKNERILSHKLSQPLTIDDLSSVSAAGTSSGTFEGTHSPQGGYDANADINLDT